MPDRASNGGRRWDSATRLAMRAMLATLRADQAATARLLADMDDDELRDLADNADTLAVRARAHLQSRGHG